MSTLSELTPAGGGGKGAKFVASGTLGNGNTVVLKADGTVEIVAESSTVYTESIPAGSGVVFNTASMTWSEILFDPSTAGQFVVVYADEGNSYYGTAIVGTVSGTSITFGSEYVFDDAIYNVSAAFDPNTAGKFILAYQDGNNASYGTSMVGTISGTSITFGSAYVFDTVTATDMSLSTDPNTSGSFVVAYRDAGSGYGKVVVGAVSGTSITFGSPTNFLSAYSDTHRISFDPNTAGRCVAAYEDSGDGRCRVCTVSGTSISIGSEYAFSSVLSASYRQFGLTFSKQDSDKFMVIYRAVPGYRHGYAIVGTVSGTSISYGSATNFTPAAPYTDHLSVASDPVTGKFLIAFQDGNNSGNGTAIVASVSGNTITLGSPVVFNSAGSSWIGAVFDANSTGKFVVKYTSTANSSYSHTVVGQIAATGTSTNLTADNFLGTADKAAADGASASITLKGGISTNQSGLTVGSDYYVQDDGTLSTTTSTVKAGRALNATTLKLTGE